MGEVIVGFIIGTCFGVILMALIAYGTSREHEIRSEHEKR